MPQRMAKLPSGKYQVKGPSGIHSKGTTNEKAESQIRLLNAVDHGWNPRKRSLKDMMKR